MIDKRVLYKGDKIEFNVRYTRPGDPVVYSKKVLEFKVASIDGARVNIEWEGSMKGLWEDLGLDHLADL